MGTIATCFDAPLVSFDGWVETGTGDGGGSDWLAEHVSPRGVTIDVRATGYWRLGVRTVVGDTVMALPGVLESLRGRWAFWLDAHYPSFYGADGAGVELPLVAELEAIWAWQQDARNEAWIWCDDAWIYGYPCSRDAGGSRKATPAAVSISPAGWTPIISGPAPRTKAT